jgi:hypothetical protein
MTHRVSRVPFAPPSNWPVSGHPVRLEYSAGEHSHSTREEQDHGAVSDVASA